MTGLFKRIWYFIVLSFLFLLILVSLFMGCALKSQNMDNVESLKTDDMEITEGNLYIDSDLDFYSLLMSSVPGLPLEGIFESDNNIQNIRYHWITEYGIFLNWGNDGVIEELGNDFSNSGEKIHWSPLTIDKNITKKEFQIILQLENATNKNILAKAILFIEATDDGFFVNDSESLSD